MKRCLWTVGLYLLVAHLLASVGWAQSGDLSVALPKGAAPLPALPKRVVQSRGGDWNVLHPTGVRPLSPEEEKWRAKHVRRISRPLRVRGMAGAALPSAHRNIQYLPAVGRQGIGSCAAWAMSYYYKTYQEAREHGWTRPNPATHPQRVMGTAFTYNLNNGGVDNGSNPYGIARTIATNGNADWALAGEDKLGYATWPTEAMFRAAIPYRAKSCAEIQINSGDGILALKEHLAGGDPAVIALGVHKNFDEYPAEGDGVSSGVLFANSGAMRANHAVCVIGYDDNKAYNDGTGVKTGAFLIVNSWGQDWGVSVAEAGTRGFMWMSYEHVKTNAWTTAVVMEDRIGYQPRFYAVIGVEHARRMEPMITLSGGDRDSPVWTFDPYPAAGGDVPVDTRIVADLTDYLTPNDGSYWLRVYDPKIDMLGAQYTGTITYFAVERPGYAPLESLDAPKDMVEMEYVYLNAGLMRNSEANFTRPNGLDTASAWGDLDNDGDMDLVSLGAAAYAGARATIYRNRGNGVFDDLDANLPAVSYGSVALGDCDGDGDLDIAICGTSGDYPNQVAVGRVYLNKGIEGFQDSGSSVTAIYEGDVKWVDYENDGDLDLAVCGSGAMKIWRNNGKAVFQNSGVASLPTGYKRMAWGDYDRDGDQDVVLGGSWSESVLYKNNGSGSFSQVQSFEGSNLGSVTWVDFDNDGRLDLCVAGAMNGNPLPVESLKIYHNDGGTYFSDSGTSVSGISGPTIAWGDYDNDGWMDMAVCGSTSESSFGKTKTTRVYRNQKGKGLLNLGFDMVGVTGGLVSNSAANLHWVDVDGDRDLDLFASGSGQQQADVPYENMMRIYRSAVSDAGGNNRPNSTPAAPAGLAFVQGSSAGSGKLQWNAASDAETTKNGLHYNVRVGTAPGLGDVVSGAISSPLLGPRVRPYVSGGQLGVSLKNLPGGNLYWSAQTIDAGLRRSAWSAESSFVSNGAVRGDVNDDDVVDVSDVVACEKMAAGTTAYSSRADLTGDGKATAADVEILRQVLMSASASGFSLKRWLNVGSAGGTLETENVKVTVPSGAMASTTRLELLESSSERPFGANTASTVVRLKGLPGTFSKALTVRFKATATLKNSTYGAIVEEGYCASLRGTRKGTRLVDATVGTDGYVSFDIPACAGSTAALSMGQEPQRAAAAAPEGYDLELVSVTGYAKYTGTHFSLRFPAALVGSSMLAIENLAGYLEGAYSKFNSAPISLSYSRRTKWPVNVTVHPLDAGVFGYAASSKWGDNYGYMEFNSDKLSQSTEMKVTAAHEFFHLIQALYDPRNRFSKAISPSPQLWLDEANAVWSEGLVAGQTNYKSTVMTANELAPFAGMQAGAGEGAFSASNHGYGMASVIKYVAQRQGRGIFADIYSRILAGKGPTDALLPSTPDSVLLSWWPTFFREFLTSKIFPFDVPGLSTGSPIFRIKGPKDVSWSYAGNLPDISAKMHRVQLGGVPTVNPDTGVAFKLKGTADTGLQLFKYKPQTNGTVEWIGAATKVKDWEYNLIVPQAPKLQSEGWWLLALATNQRKESPYTERKAPYSLDVSVVSDSYTMQDMDIAVKWALVNMQWVTFPTLRTRGKIEGEGLCDISDIRTPIMRMLFLRTAANLPQTFSLQFTCPPTAMQKDVPFGISSERWTIQGIRDYHLQYDYNEATEEYETNVHSATGSFTFDMNASRKTFNGYVYAIYDIKMDEFLNGEFVRTRTEAVSWPILMVYISQ